MRKMGSDGKEQHAANFYKAQYVTVAQFAALTPNDGDECYLVADAANGVIWHMRYNAGGTTYKWEFLGGPSVRSNIAAGEASSVAAFADLATVGPSFVAPRSGDYEVEWGSRRFDIPAGNAGPALALNWPAHAAAYDEYGAVFVSPSASTTASIGAKHFVTLVAGDTLKIKYGANANTTHTVYYRYLFVRPIRIS